MAAFHADCGLNVELTVQNRTATALSRAEEQVLEEMGRHPDNVLFSTLPLTECAQFEVMLEAGEGFIEVGVTAQDPKLLPEKPRWARDALKSCVMVGGIQLHSGQPSKFIDSNFNIKPKDRVIVMKKLNGGIIFIKNGILQAEYESEDKEPVWVVIGLMDGMRLTVLATANNAALEEGNYGRNKEELMPVVKEKIKVPKRKTSLTKSVKSLFASIHKPRKPSTDSIEEGQSSASSSEFPPDESTDFGSNGSLFQEGGPEGSLTFVPGLSAALDPGTDNRPPVSAAPHSQCPNWRMCAAFIASLNLPDAYFDSAFDNCYCVNCNLKRADKMYFLRGEPPKIYGLPIGWGRLGLRTPPQAEALNIFDCWHVCFHGTAPANLESILGSKDLLMPGDVTLDHRVIQPPSGHFTEDYKPAAFDIKQIFMSPTIKYAGLPEFAEPHRWVYPYTKTPYMVRVALQLRIAPGRYTVDRETVGLGDMVVDAKFKNDELEWSTYVRGSSILTGILVRIDS